MNKGIKQRGGKTVLWGASIEPDIIENKTVQEDLKLYDLIVAREHLQDGLVIVNMEEARRPEKNCSLNMEKRQEHRYMYTVL
mgnify:CR=1 FL=1